MNRRSAISSGTISLLIARIIYAINWFNIGSLFTFISKEFNQDVSYLGQLSGFFLLGIGLFQIPGGLFATKFGGGSPVALKRRLPPAIHLQLTHVLDVVCCACWPQNGTAGCSGVLTLIGLALFWCHSSRRDHCLGTRALTSGGLR